MFKMKRLLVPLVLVVLLGCARNPVTGKREIVLVSEGQELALGAESHVAAQSEYGFLDQPAVQTYVQQVGKKLAVVSHRPNLEWHYTAVDSPVINAFAIPVDTSISPAASSLTSTTKPSLRA